MKSSDIDETTGIWKSECPTLVGDLSLANGICKLLMAKEAKRVVEFGCGRGEYGKLLRKAGIECLALDGNPFTQTISNGFAVIVDLSKPVALGIDFDWVLCLEVGEHIPAMYEKILMDNLARNSKMGIILSWATIGQGGDGHFNERPNAYIENLMSQQQFVRCKKDETFLRESAMLPYFKDTIMVFEKGSLHTEKFYGQ